MPTLGEAAFAPASIHRQMGLSWDNLTIQCLPVFFSVPVPGPTWLYSMTEGSELPDRWAEKIACAMPERIIVPCEYNAKAFRDGMDEIGLESIPVTIINGGTNPAEFDTRELDDRYDRDYTYTFMAMGDRGARKGWSETWEAFYKTFGSYNETPNVKLIIKGRGIDNPLLEMIAGADNPDPRIEIWQEDVDDMREVWDKADCVCLPSRSEGFGMPHREAAMMGVPVITQQYGGVDDGFTQHWAITVQGGKNERVPENYEHIKGEWRKADIDELGKAMRFCFENPNRAAQLGQSASKWLGNHQTWDHSARALIRLMEEQGHGTLSDTTA